jgi:predicted molibdopterin-dependent oxidoreductase YjgC
MIETTTKTITLKIDTKKISAPSGSTILQAARAAGIYIPTLCYLECLPDYGGCRLCMVQIENMRGFPTSCTTPVAEGMQVSTKTAELQALRREILELILSEHPYTCLVCKDKKECSEFMHSTRKVTTTTGCNFCTNNGNCELQELVDYLDLEDIRFPIIYRNIPPVTDNPFYTLDYNLCILCGRCVRICNEERYSEVLSFIHRGNSALVGTAFNETQKEAGCEYCGACIDVCPTGALSEKMGNWAGIPDHSTHTNCLYCGVGCAMTVNTKGNRILNIGPEQGKKDDPPQICIRGKFIAGDITHHPERITRPHIKKDGKWREVKWQEAYDFIAINLKQFDGDRFGLIGSAHDTVENSFVLQTFARKTMKSANVDIYPDSSYSALVKDIHDYYATYGPAEIDDIPAADRIYVIGAQTQWSHPIIENRIRKAYKAGKEVIVCCSAANRTVNFSTDFQQYNKGYEHKYLHELVEKRTTRNNKSVVMIIGDEVLYSDHARENLNSLMRISTLSGNRVKLLFLIAEGNRYGATMAGMNPFLLPGFKKARKKGLTTSEMLNKQKAISALYLVGDIPVSRSLANLKFFVQQNMFFTPASEHAHVFLPLANSMESMGHIVNLEGKVINIQPAIQMNEYIRPTHRIISRISGEMKRKAGVMSTPYVEELVSLLLQKTLATGQKPKRGNGKVADFKSRSKRGQLTDESVKRHHFHYMGNSLTEIIPDLQKVLEE